MDANVLANPANSGGRCPRFQQKKQSGNFDSQFALATMPVKQHRCCHGTTATMASLPATEPLQWTVRQKTFPNHTLCHTNHEANGAVQWPSFNLRGWNLWNWCNAYSRGWIGWLGQRNPTQMCSKCSKFSDLIEHSRSHFAPSSWTTAHRRPWRFCCFLVSLYWFLQHFVFFSPCLWSVFHSFFLSFQCFFATFWTFFSEFYTLLMLRCELSSWKFTRSWCYVVNFPLGGFWGGLGGVLGGGW